MYTKIKERKEEKRKERKEREKKNIVVVGRIDIPKIK